MKQSKKNNRILIIGHFGGKESFSDGQTIKTKTLFFALKKYVTNDIEIVDTFYKKNLFKFYFMLKKAIRRCDHIFVLLSKNGMKFIFPLLYRYSKNNKKNIYHDVIGGSLFKYVSENKLMKKYIQSFKVNFLETESMVEDLKSIGVMNVCWLPNFKNVTPRFNEYQKGDRGFRFFTLSRVIKEKGILSAIDAVEKMNRVSEKKCFLDIFGPVDEQFKKTFFEKINANTFVRYCGTLTQVNIPSTISNYYCMLFPTTWIGEGFPGSVVDSFSASVPVIATDFAYNSEIIVHLKTGLLYPNKEFVSLYDCLKYVVNNEDAVSQMKNECYKQSFKYTADFNIKIIEKYLEW